jgi:hypothetical protein
MITMAQEYSTFSDELDPRVFDCLDNDFNISERAFNYPFGFNATTDDRVGSTGPAFSTPHTGSSLEESSVPRPTQAEETLRRSDDHHQPQSHDEPLDGGDISIAMEGISYDPGISHELHNNFDTISNFRYEDFILDNDWYLSEQHHTDTLNQALPANSLYDNSVTELQDMIGGLEDSMINEFANHVSWKADSNFVPMSQTPLHSLGGEVDVQRQLFTHLIEDQNVPSLMATCSHIAAGNNIHAIESPDKPLQEMNTQGFQTPDACLEFLGAPSASVGLRTLGLIANADSSTNFPNATPPVQATAWPANLVATLCHGNSPSNTAQLMPKPHSTSAIAEISENRSASTTATTKSMRQKNLSIFPAPAKSYTGTLHASNGLAHLQQVCDPRESQPRRSDKRKLTEPEKENAKKVRQVGSCIVCALGKKKVIMF